MQLDVSLKRLQQSLKLNSQRAMQRALLRAGAAVQEAWRGEARAALRTTAQAYSRAVALHILYDTVVVALDGGSKDDRRIAHMVEFGMGPGGIGTSGSYDVRKFLLRQGAKVKYGKSGPYVDVPFTRLGGHRKGTTVPSIRGLGGRKALRAARALAPGKRLGAGFGRRLMPHHRSDGLEGLERRTHASGRTKGYRLWRRASLSNTDPQAWRSKGIRPHRLQARVVSRLDEILGKAT